MNGLLLAAVAPAAAAEDIRDIRPPLAFAEWWRWPLAIALAALAAFAVIMLVRYWKNRRARALTPLQRALEALRLAEEHARAGRSREWAHIVALAVRDALAVRLGGGVLPRTTSELARAELCSVPLPEAPNILELLETCDLTRFARASLEIDALLAQTAAARELVQLLHAPPSPPLAPAQPVPQPVPVTP